MTLFEIICMFLIFLNFNAYFVISDEISQNFFFEVNRSNGANKLDVKIDTKFKKEVAILKEKLTELLQSEFKQQRREFDTLVKTVTEIKIERESSKEELIKIKKELSEHKAMLKNFIQIDFPNANQAFQAKFETSLNETCHSGFSKQAKTFSEMLNSEFANQTDSQKQLVDQAIKSVRQVEPVIDSSRWDENFNCTKECGPIMDLPGSCQEAVSPNAPKDGVYLIYIKDSGLKPFFVYCKTIENETLTVFQHREDGTENFYRDWQDYRLGFGNLFGEFWLGLERLHAMTKQRKNALHIWFEQFDGVSPSMIRRDIAIGSEMEKYKLIGYGRTGKAEDVFIGNTLFVFHNGINFSTFDNDPKGGWWFDLCRWSDLIADGYDEDEYDVDCTTFYRSFKYARMALGSKSAFNHTTTFL